MVLTGATAKCFVSREHSPRTFPKGSPCGGGWNLLIRPFLLVDAIDPTCVLLDQARMARDSARVPLFQIQKRIPGIADITEIESEAYCQQARFESIGLEA